jgi:hypothetical protein
MATLKTLTARLRVLAKDIPANASLIVRKTALAIDTALVLNTPVDTGRARGNWQVNIGGPAEGTLDNWPKANKDAVGLNGSSSQFALAAAIKATENFKGGSIFINNNLPYIVPLNNGHSGQAPPGFVQTAVLAGIQAVKNSSILEKPTGYGDTNG